MSTCYLHSSIRPMEPVVHGPYGCVLHATYVCVWMRPFAFCWLFGFTHTILSRMEDMYCTLFGLEDNTSGTIQSTMSNLHRN